jgi:hypothetical protein
MTELSNAVTVLIARMESHPEDFEMYGMNKGKFADTAEALYELAGVTDGRGKASAYWFLSEADKEALLEAWKKYHCTRMEKRVMEAIFDDGAEEREREMQRAKISMMQAQQRAQTQAMLGQNIYSPYMNNANAAQGMLVGASANSAQGMTVHSNGAVEMTNTLSLGGETLDSSILKKLKYLVK